MPCNGMTADIKETKTTLRGTGCEEGGLDRVRGEGGGAAGHNIESLGLDVEERVG